MNFIFQPRTQEDEPFISMSRLASPLSAPFFSTPMAESMSSYGWFDLPEKYVARSVASITQSAEERFNSEILHLEMLPAAKNCQNEFFAAGIATMKRDASP